MNLKVNEKKCRKPVVSTGEMEIRHNLLFLTKLYSTVLFTGNFKLFLQGICASLEIRKPETAGSASAFGG